MKLPFSLSVDFINLSLVLLFSLIIGLSQRKIHSYKEKKKLFGSDRTFTFIGLLGFILYSMDKISQVPFLIGFAIVSIYLGLYYVFKMKVYNSFGLTSMIIGLLTYSLTPIMYIEPRWMVILIVVVILIFTEIKVPLSELTSKLDKDEFITLGKFLLIAGVVLPVLPDQLMFPYISITPYRVWLAVVVISSISYLSYILKKYVFQDAGILLSGILGGLYSSTATTLVIAKLSKSDPKNYRKFAGSIIVATSMMYFRIMILVLIFNTQLAFILAPSLFIMGLISVITGFTIYYSRNVALDMHFNSQETEFSKTKNPLELKVAFVFTFLYIFFTFITHYTITSFGQNGLSALSFIVGVTDIDPFLLNLFQGKYAVTVLIVSMTTLQATMSNNILKAIYASVFSNKNVRNLTTIGFLIITALNIVVIGVIYFLYK